MKVSLSSMAEVADAGEDHGHAEFVGGRDDVLVLDRSSGLNDGGSACRSNSFEAVGEREERVGCSDRSDERQNGLLRAELCRVDAAHLAGADAGGLAVAGVDDGIGFNVLANAPGEEEA